MDIPTIEVGAVAIDCNGIKCVITDVMDNGNAKLNWFKWDPTLEPPEWTWEMRHQLTPLISAKDFAEQVGNEEVLSMCVTRSEDRRDQQRSRWQAIKFRDPKAFSQLLRILRRN